MCECVAKTYCKIEHKVSQRDCIIYKHCKLSKLVPLMTLKMGTFQTTLPKPFKYILFEMIRFDFFDLDLIMTLNFEVASKPKSKNNNDQETNHHKFVFGVEFPFQLT